MSRVKAPPAKKRMSYERDHRTAMDAPHAFRKSRPRKKARVSREHRRLAESVVESVLRGADPDDLIVPKQISGWALLKVGVETLGEKVAGAQERKTTRFLPSYTRGTYVRERHAASFKRFLGNLLRATTPLAMQRSAYLARLLNDDLPNNAPDLTEARWIRAFLADQPAWHERVRAWIARR
jgi:hypothetical protein